MMQCREADENDLKETATREKKGGNDRVKWYNGSPKSPRKKMAQNKRRQMEDGIKVPDAV